MENGNGNGTVRINTEVLAAQMQSLASQVNKLESKLDAYATHFITAEVYDLKHRELELQLSELKGKVESNTTTIDANNKQVFATIRGIDKNKTLKMWVLSTASGIAVLILTLLTEFYLTHVGKQ